MTESFGLTVFKSRPNSDTFVTRTCNLHYEMDDTFGYFINTDVDPSRLVRLGHIDASQVNDYFRNFALDSRADLRYMTPTHYLYNDRMTVRDYIKISKAFKIYGSTYNKKKEDFENIGRFKIT